MSNQDQVELDYQTYKSLLDLWSKENPIKTTKLQVLLAVNALLVAAVSASGGGFTAGKWYVYAAGAAFSLIWTFSIGRTSRFQATWQVKLQELHEKYPGDSRFSVLETAAADARVSPMLRLFGAIPSRWYLLFSPLILALTWATVLVFALAR